MTQLSDVVGLLPVSVLGLPYLVGARSVVNPKRLIVERVSLINRSIMVVICRMREHSWSVRAAVSIPVSNNMAERWVRRRHKEGSLSICLPPLRAESVASGYYGGRKGEAARRGPADL